MHDSYYFREKNWDMITHYQVKSTMENYNPSILPRYFINFLTKSGTFDSYGYQEHSWHYLAAWS